MVTWYHPPNPSSAHIGGTAHHSCLPLACGESINGIECLIESIYREMYTSLVFSFTESQHRVTLCADQSNNSSSTTASALHIAQHRRDRLWFRQFHTAFLRAAQCAPIMYFMLSCSAVVRLVRVCVYVCIVCMWRTTAVGRPEMADRPSGCTTTKQQWINVYECKEAMLNGPADREVIRHQRNC